jgi:hypothetical protein
MDAQRARRERERTVKISFDKLLSSLLDGDLERWQLLLVEHVLLPSTLGQTAGQLRESFLRLYKNSRQTTPGGKTKMPSLPQSELAASSALQLALLADPRLVTAAVARLEKAKRDYVVDMRELGPLGDFKARDFETYMQLRTRSHEVPLDCARMSTCLVEACADSLYIASLVAALYSLALYSLVFCSLALYVASVHVCLFV